MLTRIARAALVAAVVATPCAAQELVTRELLERAGDGGSRTVPLAPPSQVYTTATYGGALATATLQGPSGDACVCTNLNQVSVVCEDCDRTFSVNDCHLHDRACQDAALKGGIREYDTFFCTTRTD